MSVKFGNNLCDSAFHFFLDYMQSQQEKVLDSPRRKGVDIEAFRRQFFETIGLYSLFASLEGCPTIAKNRFNCRVKEQGDKQIRKRATAQSRNKRSLLTSEPHFLFTASEEYACNLISFYNPRNQAPFSGCVTWKNLWSLQHVLNPVSFPGDTGWRRKGRNKSGLRTKQTNL